MYKYFTWERLGRTTQSGEPIQKICGHRQLNQMSVTYLEGILPPFLQQGEIAKFLAGCWGVEIPDSLLTGTGDQILNAFNVTVFNGSSIIQTQIIDAPVTLSFFTIASLIDTVFSMLLPEVVGALILTALFGEGLFGSL